MASFQQINERLIPIKQYVTPTTGATVTANNNGYVVLFINPAGSLLALTIAFPAVPQDGDRLQITSSQAVTTVTMSGGTIIGALTSFVVGSKATFAYESTSTTWYPL